MRRSTIILMLAGIIFGAIIIVWQLLPYLEAPTLEATWSEEATEYWNNYVAKIYTLAGVPGSVVHEVTGDARIKCDMLADETDHIVHLIDVRTGMAWVWWEQSQSGGQYPGRYPTWEIAFERLRELEPLAGATISIEWSDEAIRYYNPENSTCMTTVLQSEAGGDTPEFRYAYGNATLKAEELGDSDGTVDLVDLREAIATVLLDQYPDKYSTMAEAQTRLDELEGEVNCP